MENNKLLRVTQMNAIFLDNEIYKALMQIIQNTSRFLPVGISFFKVVNKKKISAWVHRFI
jgi:hypothetical protein